MMMRRYDIAEKKKEQLRKKGKLEETFEEYMEKNKHETKYPDYLMERAKQELWRLEKTSNSDSWRRKFDMRALLVYAPQQVKDAKKHIEESDAAKDKDIDERIKKFVENVSVMKQKKKEAKARISRGEGTKDDLVIVSDEIPDITEQELREMANRPSMVLTHKGWYEMRSDEMAPSADPNYKPKDQEEKDKYYPQLRVKPKILSPEESIAYLKEDMSDNEDQPSKTEEPKNLLWGTRLPKRKSYPDLEKFNKL